MKWLLTLFSLFLYACSCQATPTVEDASLKVERASIEFKRASSELDRTSRELMLATLDLERAMVALKNKLKKELNENRNITIEKLTYMLKHGSPVEKDAVLYAAEEEQITELIPVIIDIITDKTRAPRYGDTGWGYSGRHAGSTIKGLMRKLDPEWFKNEFSSISQKPQDFFNQEDRKALRAFCSNWWNSYTQRQGSNK